MRALLVGIVFITVLFSVRAQDDDEDTLSSNFSMDQFDLKHRHPLVIISGGIAQPNRQGISSGVEQDMAFGIRLLVARERRLALTSIFKRNENGISIDYLRAPEAVTNSTE
ncbi:MAG: hypothetical protein HQ472_04480 [Ignavibacteria bacterium]|nr:hypothetical protein [Ignavibacteria bacterium]